MNSHRYYTGFYILKTGIEDHSDLGEWLTSTLEVKKLEAEERVLEYEIKVIQSECDDNNSPIVELQQLLLEIHTIDRDIVSYFKTQLIIKKKRKRTS